MPHSDQANGGIAYYVSGHGFGHAVRSIEIMRGLPAGIPLWIKSGAPEWFFRQELERPFEFFPEAYDCGAVQTDSLSIDREATLRAYAEIVRRNAGRLDSEGRWLRQVGATLVVCDVPSFPLAAAHRAGIPGVLVANFTWREIYDPYLNEYPEFAPLADQLRAEYALADVAFVTALDVPMRGFARVERMPLVARLGRNRRAEIARALGADSKKRWALFYPGNLGLDFDWRALGLLADWEFFTFYAPPGAPPNTRVLPQGAFRHQDALASMDAAVAKPGYGMVGECMANGIPLVYTSRDHFVEFAALDAALQTWGGGVCLAQKDFSSGRWREGLDMALALRPDSVRETNGGEEIAKRLMAIARDGT